MWFHRRPSCKGRAMSALFGLGNQGLACQPFPVPQPVLTRTGKTSGPCSTSAGCNWLEFTVLRTGAWCSQEKSCAATCLPSHTFFLLPHSSGPVRITGLLLWFHLSLAVLSNTVSLKRLITEPWSVPHHLSRLLAFSTSLPPTHRML